MTETMTVEQVAEAFRATILNPEPEDIGTPVFGFPPLSANGRQSLVTTPPLYPMPGESCCVCGQECQDDIGPGRWIDAVRGYACGSCTDAFYIWKRDFRKRGWTRVY